MIEDELIGLNFVYDREIAGYSVFRHYNADLPKDYRWTVSVCVGIMDIVITLDKGLSRINVWRILSRDLTIVKQLIFLFNNDKR